MINQVDLNGDGLIQYDEFVSWICNIGETAPAATLSRQLTAGAALRSAAMDESSNQIAEAFRKFDANGDGVIERDELAHVLLNVDGGVWNEASVNALATALDKNGDGQIEYDEFV